MASVLDVHRSTDVPDPVPWTPTPPPSGLRLAVDAAADGLRAEARAIRRVAGVLRSPGRSMRRVADVAGGLADFAGGVIDVDGRSARSSITGSIGPHRSYAVARARLDDIRRIRSVLGGSVNDVVLTAATSGFRALMEQRGDPVDRATLRSLVPVSIRSADDRRHDNQVSMMIAELPVGEADPVERLRRVRCELDRLKAGHEADAGATAFELAGHLPAPLYARAIRSTMSWLRGHPQYTINTVTTNVPGPPFPLYLLGRRMTEYAPYVPLSAGLRVGVAILSYDGAVRFGLTGDRDTTADLTVMAEAIEQALDDLVAASGRVSPTGRAARRSAA
jgi:diacylglycerol O-acyltransferase